jgi:hypothetical protein
MPKALGGGVIGVHQRLTAAKKEEIRASKLQGAVKRGLKARTPSRAIHCGQVADCWIAMRASDSSIGPPLTRAGPRGTRLLCAGQVLPGVV